MDTQIYRKIGRKYIPIGPLDGFYGFPCDGIWLVRMKEGNKSESCILKLDNLNKNLNFDLFKKLHENKDEVIKYLIELQNNNSFKVYNISTYDFVNELINKFSNEK